MIQVNGLTKKFGDFTALSALDCTIPAGCIYGLVGSNGAGKSTLLRLICGIYRPDKGNVTLDGRNIYENPELKEKLVFVPDELYFLPQANMLRMAQTYASFYPRFDRSRFGELTDAFKLNPKANLGTFSKGMRPPGRDGAGAGLPRPDFLFLDETFDGWTPSCATWSKKFSMRMLQSAAPRRSSPRTACVSWKTPATSWRCCTKAVSCSKATCKTSKQRSSRCRSPLTTTMTTRSFSGFDVLNFTKHGSVSNLIVRGDRDKVVQDLRTKSPILMEVLPLSLEEVFLYEMESLGYSFGDELK